MLLVFDVNFFFYFLVLEKTLIEIKKKKEKKREKQKSVGMQPQNHSNLVQSNYGSSWLITTY